MRCEHCGARMKTKGVKIHDCLRMVEKHYEVNGLRTGYTVGLYIKNQLLPKLGERIANHVRKSHIEDYKQQRLKEGASECTINRELQVLSKAFSLALEDELIERKPPIKLFPEPEPREGHYEPEEFAKWQAACRQLKGKHGELIADIVLFAYYSGWRLQECLGLHKDWIRPLDKIAVLPKSKNKTKRQKIYPLEGKVWAMIEKRLASPSPTGLLFHRNGKPVKDLTRICKTVCEQVGVSSEHFFHNLRRSATTNFNRAGIATRTGMQITGHRTEGIYHNYNQHGLQELRLAVKKAEEYIEKSTEENQVNGTSENHQEVQELTESIMTEVPRITNENGLGRYQEGDPKPAESHGFLARLWRFITKTGAN